MVDICYPAGTDWSCAYTADELAAMRDDPDTLAIMERSEALGWSTLAALIGYRLSLCPSSVRPCAARCSLPTWYTAPVSGGGGTFSPYLMGGSWFNGCGCRSADACSCTTIREVIMPTPVGAIESVILDGATLDPTAYRVDNGNRLVRTDGEAWPVCQDMNLGPDDEGVFIVNYYPYLAPNDLLRFAAGVLATEYFKACAGKNCRLPQGVTNVARNGLSMEIPTGLFPGGGTGIREVDAVIRVYNPNALTSPARVMSPDSARGRVQTWGA